PRMARTSRPRGPVARPRRPSAPSPTPSRIRVLAAKGIALAGDTSVSARGRLGLGLVRMIGGFGLLAGIGLVGRFRIGPAGLGLRRLSVGLSVGVGVGETVRGTVEGLVAFGLVGAGCA